MSACTRTHTPTHTAYLPLHNKAQLEAILILELLCVDVLEGSGRRQIINQPVASIQFNATTKPHWTIFSMPYLCIQEQIHSYDLYISPPQISYHTIFAYKFHNRLHSLATSYDWKLVKYLIQ